MPCEVTIEEFSEIINEGYAFSYQFKNEERKADNFICTDFICLDMDSGREIDEVLNDDIVEKYGSIFYTTLSHTPDHHRFRIVFELPRTLSNVDDVRFATRALAKRLGGDPKIADGARMFYGHEKSNPEILGNSLSEEFLKELIADGASFQSRRRGQGAHNKSSFRSNVYLDLSMQVKTAKGDLITLEEVNRHTPIHCPYHIDNNPSAYVAFDNSDTIFIHCKTCNETWHSRRKIAGHNFNNFEQQVLELDKTDSTKVTDKRELSGIEKLIFNPEDKKSKLVNVKIQKNEFLAFTEIHDGLTFIKSPKGSGKTEFLKKHVYKYISRYNSLEDYEEDTSDHDKPLYHKDRTILLIGHRRSLIGEICKRVGLHSYLDDDKLSQNEIIKKKERYGVCLDSLWRVKEATYDTIIIDEVEQVLSHFLSSTIAAKRLNIYHIFAQLLRRAKKIIVLDADISWVSFNSLTDIFAGEEPAKKIHIYLNQYQSDKGTIKMYRFYGQLVEELKNAVRAGKRIFVSTNSKKRVDQLAKIIGDLEEEIGNKIPRLPITSENSHSNEAQQFILNAKTDILNYNAVIASPSLGTGIDITFENKEEKIDHVFGFYEPLVNSHFDIDQQLSRVRHPKAISVYISPRPINFETDLGVAEEDIQREFLNDMSLSEFDIINKNDNKNISNFLKLCARSVSRYRHSMNLLRFNFIDYKESQGFKIEWAEEDHDQAIKGNAAFYNAKSDLLDQEIDDIMSAKPLNLYDYERCKDRIGYLQLPLNREFNARFKRTSLELFYREPITENLIIEDAGGRFRNQIRRYISVLKNNDPEKMKIFTSPSPEDHVQFNSIKDYDTGSLLIHKLLLESPVFNGKRILEGEEYSVQYLEKFISLSKEISSYMETQLGILTQGDIAEKPIQHLGKLLRQIGLKNKKSRTMTVDHQKLYFYKVDEDRLKRIKDIASRQTAHKSTKEMIIRYGTRWEYLNDVYDFSYDNWQKNWLCPGFDDDGKPYTRRKSQGYQQWANSNGLFNNEPQAQGASTLIDLVND